MPFLAASVVRTLALTETDMPMNPARAEKAAPIRKPMAEVKFSPIQMTRNRTAATMTSVRVCRVM